MLLLAPFKSKPIISGFENDTTQQALRRTRKLCGQCFSDVNHHRADESPFVVNVLQPPAILKQRSLFALFAPDFYYSFINSKTYLHKYSDVKNEVVKGCRVNEGVQKAIKQICSMQENDANRQLLLRHQWKRVDEIFSRLCAHVNRFVINITAWVLLKVLRRLFRTVQVKESQMVQLQKASQKNLPIIFLPNHQSHLDYILLTFAIWQWDIRIPHVAAGDNLDVTFFSFVLRCLGGFFIKRRLDNETGGEKDYVYRSILHSYITELLKRGEYIEFYMEAGRTRTGKTVLPKAGLLSIIVDAFTNGSITDCFLVPVSICYEKVVDNEFVLELHGEAKKPENFWDTVKGIWHALRSSYGNVRLEFAEPISLKSLLEKMRKKPKFAPAPPSPPLLDDPSLSPIQSYTSAAKLPGANSFSYSDSMSSFTDDIRITIKAACNHIVCDFTQNAVPMCTNLLAFLLLNKYPNGGRLGDVVEDFRWLAGQVLKRGRDLGFNGDAKDVVQYAIDMLGPNLVIVEQTTDDDNGIVDIYSSKENLHNCIIKSNFSSISNVLRLAFYKNSVVSIFLLESIITNAILTLRPNLLNNTDGGDLVELDENDIYARCYALCDLLGFEFIFTHPCVPLQVALSKAMDRLMENGIIKPNFTIIEANDVARDSKWDANVDDLSVGRNHGSSKSKRFYVSDLSITKCPAAVNGFYVADEQQLNSDEKEDVISINPKTPSARLIRVQLSSSINRGFFTFFANVLQPILQSYGFALNELNDLMENSLEERLFVSQLLNKAKETMMKSNGQFSGEFVNVEYFRNAIKWAKWKNFVKSLKTDDNKEALRLDESYKNMQEFQKYVNTLCKLESLR